MIGVLTHHWAKPELVEAAKKMLDGNGLAQSKAPGYGQRLTFIGPVQSELRLWPALEICGPNQPRMNASRWPTSLE